ncbi:hypothetical protein FB45DRAFT_947443 [Roridomyces roridus]|uniref:F-box domain-containing protein n=1 Tax=Roridomyces roridus TaxID=1738132 RepID=A0AAD7B1Z5_9AGAR|nr:hypothetical protein FB45DRAFT_947443 [Roridomyces roridus]
MACVKNPLELPELLDQTLGLVHARRDLCASALVSRSWVHPAQSRLFSSVELRSGSREMALLLPILQHSPHLVQFISALAVTFYSVDTTHPSKIMNLPFSRLTTLDIRTINDPSTAPLFKLLKVPSLVDVTIFTAFKEWDEFAQIWEGCSTAIQHLSLRLVMEQPALPTHSTVPIGVHRPIKLKSFGGQIPADKIAPWLFDPRCAFDISNLKALQLYKPGLLTLLDLSAESLDSIELLSLTISHAFDASLPRFHHVTQLDIEPKVQTLDPSNIDYMSRNIPPIVRHRISAVRFHESGSSPDYLGSLGEQLSKLHDCFPQLRIVMINFRQGYGQRDAELFKSRARALNWRVDPRVTVRYNFDWENRIPWYSKIL